MLSEGVINDQFAAVVALWIALKQRGRKVSTHPAVFVDGCDGVIHMETIGFIVLIAIKQRRGRYAARPRQRIKHVG